MAMKSILRRFRPPQVATSLQSARTIVSMSRWQPKDKPAPYPYMEKDFKWYNFYLDKTTFRLDENSKLILVDGAHAVGKTKVAKELAEEFGFLYMPPINFDNIFINYYGVDLRDYNDIFPEKYRCFDEKAFFRDPFGGDPGHVDRFLMRAFVFKFIENLKAVRHILNTGQGVVTESNPFSHYAILKAAHNAGWIHSTTRKCVQLMMDRNLWRCLRPNVIVYLDAPVEKVQANIKARGNEWDKDSPIWSNTRFLNDIYDEYRKNYLREQEEYSEVLVYDWTEPGESELIAEDIENLELDLIPIYGEQQKDWRFHTEEGAASVRFNFTNIKTVIQQINALFDLKEFIFSERLIMFNEEIEEMEDVFKYIKSESFGAGCNPLMGDNPLKMMLMTSPKQEYKYKAQLKPVYFDGCNTRYFSEIRKFQGI